MTITKQLWLFIIWVATFAFFVKSAVAFPLPFHSSRNSHFVPLALQVVVVRNPWLGVLPHNRNLIQKPRLFANSDVSGGSVEKSDAQPSLPTLEQLRSDPFMKQLQHASQIVSLLGLSLEQNSEHEPNSRILEEMLQAQFSHSDGIRGFFVTYLTDEGTDSPADRVNVPAAFFRVLQSSRKDDDDFIRLCCMNVLMPTAMTTLHQDPKSAQKSQITAQRGIRVLSALVGLEDGTCTAGSLVQSHCHAILHAAAAGAVENKENDLVSYWIRFMQNWDYGDLQKRDIVQAIQSVLSV